MIKPNMLCLIASKTAPYLTGRTCTTLYRDGYDPVSMEVMWMIHLHGDPAPVYLSTNVPTGECKTEALIEQSHLIPIDGYEGDDMDDAFEFTPEDLVTV